MAATTNGTGVKREAESLDETSAPKKSKEELTPKEEALSNLQYRHLPYQEQLKKKQEETQAISKEFNNTFLKRYPQFAAWYKGTFLETRYKFDQIMTSPKTFAYRNKCELTIGFNPELNKLCAGPRISDGADGKVQVGPCDQDLIHLTPSMIEIAQDFSNFLDKWNYLEEKCPWYNLFIRATKSGEHMLIFIMKEDTQETLKALKAELVKYYTEDYDKKHLIKSIYLQPKAENSTKKTYELEFLHAHGDEFLIEDILDLKLVVTPSIYFRINSFAAEITYQKVLDVGDLKKKRTLVLDLWCGCGALSLLAAKRAAYVVGIDPSKWNIKKAQFMARYNKIKNIEFIIARPEDGIKQIWRNLMDVDEIVIYADPPTLCKMTELGEIVADIPTVTRFIYIHSSHKLHIVKNMMNLTQASLLPTRYIPVDVSPHSVRVELIVLLRKVNPYDEKASGPRGGPVMPDPGQASYIEEIERRAFAMGMAKAMEAAPPPPRGGYDDAYGDYGYGGQSRGGSWRGGGYGGGAGAGYGGGFGGGRSYDEGRLGGGYGGGRKFDEGRPGSGFGGGFGPSGFGPDADTFIGGFKGAYGPGAGRGGRGGFRGKRGGR